MRVSYEIYGDLLEELEQILNEEYIDEVNWAFAMATQI